MMGTGVFHGKFGDYLADIVRQVQRDLNHDNSRALDILSDKDKLRLMLKICAKSLRVDASLESMLAEGLEGLEKTNCFMANELVDFVKNYRIPIENLKFLVSKGLLSSSADMTGVRVSEFIALAFIQGLRKAGKYKKSENPDNVAEIRSRVAALISPHVLEEGNLYKEMVKLGLEFPDVNIGEVLVNKNEGEEYSFDKNVLENLVSKIDEEIEKILINRQNAYLDAVERKGKKKGKKLNQESFILHFLINRVFYLERQEGEGRPNVKIDRVVLKKFLHFLYERGIAFDEKLYNLLFESFHGIANIHKQRRKEFRKIFDKSNVGRGEEGDDLMEIYTHAVAENFDGIFDEFKDEIAHLYEAKKIPKDSGRTKLLDFVDFSADGFFESIYPKSGIYYLKKIYRDAMEHGDFDEVLKLHFNSKVKVNRKGGHKPINIEKLKEDLGKNLEDASKFIKSTISDALNGVADKETRNAFNYLPEILDCRDVEELFIWVSFPYRFVEKFPQYKDYSKKLIAFQAGKMLWLLMYWRTLAFSHTVRNLEPYRKILTDFFYGNYEVKETDKKLTYRTLQQMDDSDKPVFVDGEPVYSAVTEGNVLMDSADEFVQHEGKRWKLFSVRKKDVLELEVTLLDTGVNGDKSKRKKVVKLWFLKSRQGGIFDRKENVSILSSALRKEGKVSDYTRGAFTSVPGGNPADIRAFRDDLPTQFMVNVVKMLDSESGRNKDNKKLKNASSKSSFQKGRDYQATVTANITVEEDGSDEDFVIEALFELQGFNTIEDFIVYFLSPDTKHHHDWYKSERAMDLMDGLFPALVWGVKYFHLKQKLRAKHKQKS